MANNFLSFVPFSGTASKTAAFSDIGFTDENVAIVFKVGSPLKSYVPGRTINAITGLEKGEGYYIIPKIDADFNQYFLKSQTMITLTDAATIQWNLSAGNLAKVSLSADRAINITNVYDGATGLLRVRHTAANSDITLPGTKADGFAWKTAAGNTTVIGFIYTTAEGYLWFNDGFATT